MLGSTIKFTLQTDPPVRLDKALAREIPLSTALSRTRITQLIAEGAVKINQSIQKNPRARAALGDLVEVQLPVPRDNRLVPEKIALDVIYEDEDIIVINKPSNMVVHPGKGSETGTLVHALLAHCGASLSGIGGDTRPGIVHRIDKDTSGLLVVAKTDAAHINLAQQFQEHSVEREYDAVVYGAPSGDDPRLLGITGVCFEANRVLRISTQLARSRANPRRQTVTFSGGRHAITRTRVIKRFGKSGVISKLSCWLETGRTHQIRVHLAYVGHGLIGDPIYGSPRKLSSKFLTPEAARQIELFERQALHARIIGFMHPISGQAMRFESQVPDDMANLIETLDLSSK
ncbi:MAG: pseudouridine synthase [Aestuariivita sp.]|nr:pseudouridine synthase [Aestuariivita sp.]MCY4203264.1 pseudouridine synthase [Aestuariivita sp.]